MEAESSHYGVPRPMGILGVDCAGNTETAAGGVVLPIQILVRLIRAN